MQARSAFPWPEIAGQPLPNKERTTIAMKCSSSGILRTLGYWASSCWSIGRRTARHQQFDGCDDLAAAHNKRHPGIGFKLLLPVELHHFMERGAATSSSARLDKREPIPSLQWTGEALFDVANGGEGSSARPEPSLRMLTEHHRPANDRRLPRSRVRGTFQVLIGCSCSTTPRTTAPKWRVSSDLFESERRCTVAIRRPRPRHGRRLRCQEPLQFKKHRHECACARCRPRTRFDHVSENCQPMAPSPYPSAVMYFVMGRRVVSRAATGSVSAAADVVRYAAGHESNCQIQTAPTAPRTAAITGSCSITPRSQFRSPVRDRLDVTPTTPAINVPYFQTEDIGEIRTRWILLVGMLAGAA